MVARDLLAFALAAVVGDRRSWTRSCFLPDADLRSSVIIYLHLHFLLSLLSISYGQIPESIHLRSPNLKNLINPP